MVRVLRKLLWMLALTAGLWRPAAAEDVDVRIDASGGGVTWYVTHLYEAHAIFNDSVTFTGITSPVLFTLRIGPEFFSDFVYVNSGEVVTTGEPLVSIFGGRSVATAGPSYFAGGTDLVVNLHGFIGNRGSSTSTLYEIYRGTLTITPVPEPAGWLLMAAGAACLALRLRRRPKPAARRR